MQRNIARRHLAFLGVILGVSVVLRCTVALRPLEFVDGMTIPDDAYLALSIAKNIASGLGPFYWPAHTNGFQPLYAFIMAPVFLLFPNDLITPVHIALILLTAFDTMCLYLLYRVVSFWSTSPVTPFLAASVWVFNPYVIAITLNGLETVISCFMIVLTLYYLLARFTFPPQNWTGRSFLCLSIIMGVAILARVDNILLSLSVMLILIWKQYRSKLPQKRIAVSTLLLALGILITNMPWLIYSYHFTGDFYPISGKAVRFISLSNVHHDPTLINWYLPVVKRGIAVVVKKHWMLLGTITVIVLGLAVRKELHMKSIVTRVAPFSPIILYAALLTCTYLFYVFAPWFFERYLFPLTLVILFLFSIFIDKSFESIVNRKRRIAFAVGVFLLTVGTHITSEDFRDLFFSKDTHTRGYMNLGLWTRERFQDGTIVGCSQTGALGYFATNLRVINLDGVVNKECYEWLLQRRNMDYIRKMNIAYVIGWPVNVRFIVDNSTDFREGDLVPVEKIDGFKSWGQEWYLMKVRL